MYKVRKMANKMSLSELGRYGMQLPVAEEFELFDSTGEVVEGYKGIRDVDSRRLIKVFSKDYSLVQNKDVLGMASSIFTELGLEGTAKVEMRNAGEDMSAYIIFSNKTIQDDANGIALGVKIRNSYNGNSALRVECYGERLICSNGMTIKKLYSKSVMVHRNLKDTATAMETAIRDVISKSVDFQALVARAMQESYTWAVLQSTIAQMLKPWTASHLTKIFAKCGIEIRKNPESELGYDIINIPGKYTLAKWDIYNYFTNYLTHEDISYNMKQKLENMSEIILTAPVHS